MKKVIFAVIFTVIFQSEAVAKSWQTKIVDRVIDNEHLQLFDGKIIKILGIDAPLIADPKKFGHCTARATNRKLKKLLEKQEIKIRRDETEKWKNGILPRHVKLAEGELLAKFMLENGLAKFKKSKIDKKYEKKFQKAERRAILAKNGIWNDCGRQKSFAQIRKKASRRYRSWRKKYAQFLAPISVGKVARVRSGKQLELKNGLKIRLLGIETPLPDDPRRGFACFGKWSKLYLEFLVLEEKIFIKKDISDLNDRYELLRYIYLPPKNELNRDIPINRKMIADGFARSFWETKDSRMKKEFDALEKEVFSNPRGAWVECIREILAERKK